MLKATTKILEDLSFLNLYPDYLSSWQKALHASLSFFSNKKEPALVFYIKETQLFILHIDNKHILFSTVLKIDAASIKNLDAALISLKTTLPQEPLETLIIGHHGSVEASLLDLFPEGKHQAIFDNHQDTLLLFGSALLAQKNSFNLLKKSWAKPSKINVSLFKNLTKINAVACCVMALSTLSFFVYHNQSMRGLLRHLDPTAVPNVVSQEDIHKKMEYLGSLKYLEAYVPQVPTPSEVMAFLSDHPALNYIDKTSGKNTSIHHLDYSLIDLKTLRLKLSCQFPQRSLQDMFEKDLKQKHIPFTSSTQAHLTHYEFIIKKGLTL